MSNPKELLYADTHEWVRVEGNEATVGITEYAQNSLGDITFVELPKLGATLNTGDEMGVVESVKAASDLYSPVSGKVLAINEQLADQPGIINQSPYGEGWMIKIELSAKPEGLLSADGYAALCSD